MACQKAIVAEENKLLLSLNKAGQKEAAAVMKSVMSELQICSKRLLELEEENAILFERVRNIDAENQRLMTANQELTNNKSFAKKIVSKIRRNKK